MGFEVLWCLVSGRVKFLRLVEKCGQKRGGVRMSALPCCCAWRMIESSRSPTEHRQCSLLVRISACSLSMLSVLLQSQAIAKLPALRMRLVKRTCVGSLVCCGAFR